MSIDDRLRSGLARNAAAYEPDVEPRLRRLTNGKIRRRRGLGGAGTWVPVAAAFAVVALMLVGSGLYVERPAPAPILPATTRQLTGRLQVELPDRPGLLRADRLAGSWVLRLSGDGTMRVSAPSAYRGVLSGAFFESSGSTFRTSVFGQDLCSGLPLGRYTWQRTGSLVRFTVADDQCAGRVAVLTSAAWRLS